jgi:hypothetical protein
MDASDVQEAFLSRLFLEKSEQLVMAITVVRDCTHREWAKAVTELANPRFLTRRGIL